MRRLIAALALLSGPSVADGAFPNGMQVLVRASDPQRIYLGTTFGLVFSTDAGASFRYVCEPYITGGNNVSQYVLEADGTLLALSDKLRRSTDGGCSWTTVAAPAGSRGWLDVFADPQDATRALGVAAGASNSVWISHDGARTFSTQLLSAPDYVDSVESAASNPSILYAATALYSGPGSPALLRSADAGGSWARSTVSELPPVAVRILAVSPDDPNSLWLRASNTSTNIDDLLVSSDGGKTITELFYVGRTLTGFVRGSDGTLYAADGQPGVLVRAPGASTFSRAGSPHLLCLGRAGSRLYGCGDGLKDPFNLAVSDDGGASWKALLAFAQIQGPATCAPVPTACASDWAYQQSQFAAITPKQGCSTTGGGAAALFALLLVRATTRRRRSESIGPFERRMSAAVRPRGVTCVT